MNYNRVKNGLTLTVIGLLFEIIGAIFAIIAAYESSLANVDSVLSTIAAVVEIVGLIFLGISGSKYFRKAFITVIASIILALLSLIFTSLKWGPANSIVSVAICVAELAFTFYMISGCGEVSTSSLVKSLSKFVYLLTVASILCSIAIVILAFVNQDTLKTAINVCSTIAGIASVSANILFIFLLFGARKTLNK